MKSKILNLFLVIFLAFTLFALFGQKSSQAQEEAPEIFIDAGPEPEEQLPGTANCFDYYKFGSVKLNIGPQLHQFTAGQPAIFSGQLKNENDYPVVGGALFVRVSRQETDEARQRFFGNNIVDEFFAEENINIDKGTAKDISFSWSIPEQAPAGDYRLDFFFTIDKKMNLAGLPFTNEIIGGSTNFKVESDKTSSFYFDRSETKVNNSPYYHIGQWPVFEPGSQVRVSQPLVNETDEDKVFQVTYELYWWDSLKKEDKLDSRQEEITLAAGSSQTLSYQIDSLDLPVYALRMKARSANEQAILNLRATTNTELPRLNYFGLTKFPLQKGEMVTLFSCLHNTSNIDTEGKARVQVLDENNKLIDQLEYQGKISSAMMGLAKEISVKKSLDYLKLKAELFDKDGQLVDSLEQIYNCSAFQPAICLARKKTQPLYIVLIILVVLVLIGLLIKRAKKQETIKSLILLFLGLGAFASLVYYESSRSLPEPAKAADGWQVSQSKKISQDYDHKMTLPKNRWKRIAAGNISVEYRMEVDKDSSLVKTGETINFTFQPAEPFFTALGGAWDTPWGRWIKETPPASLNLISPADEDKYFRTDHPTDGQWHTYKWDKDYDSGYSATWVAEGRPIMKCGAKTQKVFDDGGITYYEFCSDRASSTWYERRNGTIIRRYEDNFWYMPSYEGTDLSNEWQGGLEKKPGAVSWGCWKPEVSVSSSNSGVIECSGLSCQAKGAGDATLTVKVEPTTCRIFSVIEMIKCFTKGGELHCPPGLWWPSDVWHSRMGNVITDKEAGQGETNRLILSEDSFEWTFSVVVSNYPPIADAQKVPTEKNTSVIITLTGSDRDGNKIEFLKPSDPSYGKITYDPNKFPDTGKLTYTPNLDYVGSDTFTFEVNDGTTDSAPATVTVVVGNRPPGASNPKTQPPNWCPSDNYCVAGGSWPSPNNVTFSWEFTDPDGDKQQAYQIQVATDDNFSNLVIDTGKIVSNSNSFTPDAFSGGLKREELGYNQTYHWRVKVWDNKEESAWTYEGACYPGPSCSRYTTPHHKYPYTNFDYSPKPAESGVDNPVTFSDKTFIFFDGAKAWKWDIEGAQWGYTPSKDTDQNPVVIFPGYGAMRVTLWASDSYGYKCPCTKTIQVGPGLPWWREIWPF